MAIKDSFNRFWNKVKVSPMRNGCWMWTGGRAKKRNGNYGRFYIGQKCFQAHRLMFFYVTGSWPGNKYVLHKCDTPPCVNPEHLYLGTQYENMRDRKIRGRAPSQSRASNGNAKLTENDVMEIRSLYSAGTTQRAIASLYSISKTQVGNVVNFKEWP